MSLDYLEEHCSDYDLEKLGGTEKAFLEQVGDLIDDFSEKNKEGPELHIYRGLDENQKGPERQGWKAEPEEVYDAVVEMMEEFEERKFDYWPQISMSASDDPESEIENEITLFYNLFDKGDNERYFHEGQKPVLKVGIIKDKELLQPADD